MGVGCGKKQTHGPPFRQTKQGGAGGCHGFHDGAQIVDSFFERGRALNSVRHALATLIKNNDPKVLTQRGQKNLGFRIVPIEFKLGNEARDLQQILLAMPEDLVGNAEVARKDVLGFRPFNGHHEKSPDGVEAQKNL